MHTAQRDAASACADPFRLDRVQRVSAERKQIDRLRFASARGGAGTGRGGVDGTSEWQQGTPCTPEEVTGAVERAVQEACAAFLDRLLHLISTLIRTPYPPPLRVTTRQVAFERPRQRATRHDTSSATHNGPCGRQGNMQTLAHRWPRPNRTREGMACLEVARLAAESRPPPRLGDLQLVHVGWACTQATAERCGSIAQHAKPGSAP